MSWDCHMQAYSLISSRYPSPFKHLRGVLYAVAEMENLERRVVSAIFFRGVPAIAHQLTPATFLPVFQQKSEMQLGDVFLHLLAGEVEDERELDSIFCDAHVPSIVEAVNKLPEHRVSHGFKQMISQLSLVSGQDPTQHETRAKILQEHVYCQRALAFASGQHGRLGSNSLVLLLHHDTVGSICRILECGEADEAKQEVPQWDGVQVGLWGLVRNRFAVKFEAP
jgi:hypothetical protein